MKYLLLGLFLAGCASAADVEGERQAELNMSPLPVVEAERAFAARAHEIGSIPSFCETSATDSQLIGRAGLINAHERMCALSDDGDRDLYWAPSFAGIARSGDIGFTTGPASTDAAHTPSIQYFTVWRRQADGSWKWIFDGGVGAVSSPGPYVEDPQRMPVAATGVGSATRAVQEVSDLEIGAAATGALSDFLAPDAHVYRQGQARAIGGEAAAAALVYPTDNVATHLVREEASEAGDLVFTLGEAHWSGGQGFFARIWQHQPDGWRIVYDQLVPWTPPAAN